jgi:membrane-associated protease RseP (regulator of RpoE activity)
MTATTTRRPTEAVDSGQAEDERSSEAQGVMRLAITILLIVGLSLTLNIGGAVLVVSSILLMIMLHEFGHFITARWAGMRVTDFFVGFGPTIWSIKRGDTRYGVKAIPAGGFVRVIGMNSLEEIEPEDEPYTYRSKSYWQRLRFASAGTFMHFAIAFVLMIVLLAGFGIIDGKHATTKIDTVAPSVTADGKPSPASAAGIRSGDRIVGINGVPIKHWDQVSRGIHASNGRQMHMTIERDGERFSVAVTPVDPRTDKDIRAGVPEQGIIGISAQPKIVKTPMPQAIWKAGFELKTLTWQSTKALGGLFTKSNLKTYSKQLGKTGPADPETEGNRLLSPVGIARIADASAESGVGSVLTLLIAINVFVGIFNMVPLPPFDGGHVAVATYEAIRSRISGRRHMADMNKLLPVAYAVVAALFVLSLSALWLDIMHPFNLG